VCVQFRYLCINSTNARTDVILVKEAAIHSCVCGKFIKMAAPTDRSCACYIVQVLIVLALTSFAALEGKLFAS
jgi:hypothetical protein